MYVVHPFIMGMVSVISNSLLIIIGMPLLVLFIIDNVLSFNTMFKINGFDFKNYVDNTEEITELVREHLMKHSFFTKRLVSAFPNIKVRMRKYRNK